MISWALPGQPGLGHVNGRTKDCFFQVLFQTVCCEEEVEFLFQKRGFWKNSSASSWLSLLAPLERFRTCPGVRCEHWWIKRNIMVFERLQPKSLAECG